MLVGLTATGIATILFIVPLLVTAIFVRPVAKLKRLAAMVLLCFGLAVGTSPCWIHNYFIARDPVVLSAHSGINFWLGNNPDATGYPHFPGMHAGQAAMLQDSTALAETAAGHALKRSEVSSYWSAKAKSYIASHPREWLQLLGRKALNFWNAFQYDDVSVIGSLVEQRIILPGLQFGLVAAFALAGALFAVRKVRRSRWIIAAILLHMAAVLTVFVTERYRLAVVPGLLLLAAFGLWTFWENGVVRNHSASLAYLIALTVAAVFVSLPRTDPDLWALDAYNSGKQALETGDLALAEARLRLARAYVPDNAETTFALGNLAFAKHDKAQAKAYYSATIQLDPAHDGAYNNLGVLALDAEQWQLAASFFVKALEHAPMTAKTHYLLAKARLGTGDTASARKEVETALQLAPNQNELLLLREEIDARAAGQLDR